MWYVYILLCSDNSYYVGNTNDIPQRLARHNAGRGSQYTSTRIPVLLVWKEIHNKKDQAVKREMQIKKWSKAKKKALIDGDMTKLRGLAKRRKQA